MLCYRCGSYNPDGNRRCAVCGQAFSAQRRASRNLSAQPQQQNRVKAPLEPGAYVADRYRVVSGIAQGAVGWVLRARDEEVDVDVAVKLIASNLLQTDTDRATFARSVKVARRIQHQNVARIYDDGEHDKHVFYTMPYLEGLTLRKILDLRLDRGQVFTVAEALPLFGQLALGLDNLEKLGHHGGVRPTSIVVMPDILKLTGVPHWRGLPRRPFLAQLGHRRALEYLAPEARRDDASAVDSRADVFSMAVIFGEMLTGHVYGRDAAAWGAAVQRLPGRLVSALSQALSEEPRKRFPSAGAFFDCLAEAVADMQFESSEPVPLSQPTRPKALGEEHTAVEGDEDQPAPIPGEQSGSVTPAVVLRVPAEARPTLGGSRPPAIPRELSGVDAGPKQPVEVAAGLAARPGGGAKDLAKAIPDLGATRPGRRGRTALPRQSSRAWVGLVVAVVLVAGATAGGILWFKNRSARASLPAMTDRIRSALAGGLPTGQGGSGSASGKLGGAQATIGAAGTSLKSATTGAATTGATAATPAGAPPGSIAPASATAATSTTTPGTTTPGTTTPGTKTTATSRPPTLATSASKPAASAQEAPGTRPPEPGNAAAGQHTTSPAPGGGREVASLEKPPPAPPEPPSPAPPKERCPSSMVEVKGGTFQMGSSPSDPMRNFGELDPTPTAVAGFCIDIYEYPNQRGKAPTAGVAWAKAKQLCEKQGKRLCSEAEWENACKGGRSTVFPFGNSFQAGLCNMDSASADKKAVGAGDFSRCRSGYGVADLAGNVAEWTSSRFAEDVPDRVVKGGSADQAGYTGRCAARANEAPGARRDALGFRCCADLK